MYTAGIHDFRRGMDLEKTEFIPYNGKIADITHADTNRHTLDLTTTLSDTRAMVAIFLKATRMAGTGDFRTYPNEGAEFNFVHSGITTITIVASGTNRLQYALTVANDDWDLYCLGYVVEA